MPIPSDRALRRLVADLAAAHPDDVEAVLEDLEPGPRARARDLLRAYLGEAAGGDRASAATAAVPPPQLGLSPWLAARVGETPAGPPSPLDPPLRPFRMTPRARAALEEVAANLPRATPAMPLAPAAARRSLRAHLAGLLIGDRS